MFSFFRSSLHCERTPPSVTLVHINYIAELRMPYRSRSDKSRHINSVINITQYQNVPKLSEPTKVKAPATSYKQLMPVNRIIQNHMLCGSNRCDSLLYLYHGKHQSRTLHLWHLKSCHNCTRFSYYVNIIVISLLKFERHGRFDASSPNGISMGGEHSIGNVFFVTDCIPTRRLYWPWILPKIPFGSTNNCLSYWRHYQ